MPGAHRLPVLLDAVRDLARHDAPAALASTLAEIGGLVADATEARDPAELRRLQAALQAEIARMEQEQRGVARELGALQRESIRRPRYRSLGSSRPAVDWRG